MAYRILLCEDNERNIKLIKDILEFYGYEVHVAVDGEEGVRMAKELMPEIILMDIQMPKMDGLTAIHEIRKEGSLAHIPVVAITSFAMAGDKERILKAGADYYLSKPIDTRALPKLIKEILNKKDVIEGKE